MSFPCLSTVLAALLLAPFFAAPVAAQDAVGFDLQLNNAEDVQGVCRLTFVARNTSQTAFSEVSFDVGVFDKAGKVRALLALQFGTMGGVDTQISRFSIPDMTCGVLSDVVVNRAACVATGASEPSGLCSEGLSASSLIDIRFYD